MQRGWDSETSGKKAISHIKSYTMHVLAYFINHSKSIRYALHKVEYHENYVRWVYLITILNMGKSEVSEKIILISYTHVMSRSCGLCAS